MKRVAIIVVAVVFFVACGVVAWGAVGVGAVVDSAGSGADVDPAAAKDAVRAAFFADLDAVDAVAFFARRDGADASAVLNGRVPWRAGSGDVRPLVLPPKVEEVVKDNNKWLSIINDPAVDSVDTSLLRGLSAYTKWDVFRNLPADVAPGTNLYDAPLPAYLPLRHLARVHLLKAMKANASPTFAEAAHDVEALAYLLSTSNLLAGVVGTVLLKDVVAAHDRAVDDGVVGDHVVVVDVDGAERMRRVLLTAPAFVELVKDADTERVLRHKSVALCTTWNETVMRARMLEPLLDDEERAWPSWGVEQQLGGCALAPTDPQGSTGPLMCTADVSPSCARQLAIVRAVPPLRRRMKAQLSELVSLNYLNSYPAPKAPTSGTAP